jgi:CHAT domain-containing protein
LRRIYILTYTTILITFTICSEAQTEDIYTQFQKFARLYNAGDLVKSEETLLLILKSKENLQEPYLVAAYNNLGVINMMLGKYGKAIGFYDQAEALVSGKGQNLKDLADIYSNKGYIYYINKSFDVAISHYEKSIRIYTGLNIRDNNIQSSLSSTYLNIGIAFLNIKDYTTALDYFNKSSDIKSEYNLPGLALVYMNVAKAWVKLNNPVKAEEYYIKSIERFTGEFDENYFRLAEVYFDYGLFLRSEGRNSEALDVHIKALSICLKNYGEKHSLVALSYKHLGDHYFNQSDYKTALDYYQKSIISVVSDFSNTDIYSNPSIDSSLLDIRLFDGLKRKAKALELLAAEQNDQAIKLRAINKSLETIKLALHLIDRIRNNYPTEESRIYLSENEKETYLFAIHITGTLFTLTGESSLVREMYSIAQKSKAAVLREEVTENELLNSAGVPDSTMEKLNSLTGNIAAYNNLIFDEARGKSPDSTRISFWKDAIFEMNREVGKLNAEINSEYPEYYNLLLKTEPLPLTGIQDKLHRDETILDYIISGQYNNGERDLFIFLITRNNIEFHKSCLDSGFFRKAEIIRNPDRASVDNNFRDYTGALNFMYNTLLKPVEEYFAGKRIIIIPDEEIAWLSFDALLMNSPEPEQQDYEGLHYLVRDYAVSYGYSSSLIFSKRTRIKEEKILAFSPGYSDGNNINATFDRLPGASEEIRSIFRWFNGMEFTGDLASETNFMKVISDPAIFHLAMHSISDTLNSKYSYLLFDTRSDTIEDGKLYNYEISLVRLNSPMVVLSACNSGTGTLYHSEGLVSLARGFILAGASSVVRTAWEVNDETSAEIMSGFYYYLSKGKHKDEAMRFAKLDYLKDAPPSEADPYFWAAYEILGDSAPVAHNSRTQVLVITSMIIASWVLFIYFRRRRIFSDGFL